MISDRGKTPVLIRVGSRKEGFHPAHIHPPMDLKYIQAALEAGTGRKPRLIDNWILNISSSQDLAKKVLSLSPDIAIIKAATPCIEEGIELAKRLKQAGVITIGTGQQVEHMRVASDQNWLDAFQIPVSGDPEEILPSIVAEINSGEELTEISRKYNRLFNSKKVFYVSDPDMLKTPSFSDEELRQYAFPFPLPGPRYDRWGYILTAWGCPHQCPHCSGVIRKTCGAITRVRTPSRVVTEIEALLACGAQGIVFEDDSFLSDREHFLEICEEIIRRGLKFPWIAHVRCDELNPSIAKKAGEAGAVLFKVGIESGSPRVIESLGKASSGDKWLVQTRETFTLLRKNKIGSVALFLIGSPGERVSDIRESAQLASGLAPDYIQVQIFTLYPDTALYLSQNRDVRSLNFKNSWHYRKPAWTPGLVVNDALLSEQRKFYKSFYFRSDFIFKHIIRCWRFYCSGISSIRHLAYPLGWIKPR